MVTEQKLMDTTHIKYLAIWNNQEGLNDQAEMNLLMGPVMPQGNVHTHTHTHS